MRDDMHRESRPSDALGRTVRRPSQGLHLLSELRDWKVAEGDPDVRGWQVRTSDGKTIGKVDELLVDVEAQRVRYLDVELDRRIDPSDRHILVPIGAARLDDDNDIVHVSQGEAELVGAPYYDRSRLDDSYESAVRGWYGERTVTTGEAATPAAAGNPRNADLDPYAGPLYDDARFFGSRRRGRENESYLARSGDALDAETQRVRESEVDLRRSVEADRAPRESPRRDEGTVD